MWRTCSNGSATLKATVAWLVEGARSAPQPTDILEQLCTRLLECGLPLDRVAVFVRTLHPSIMGRRFVWRLGAPVEATDAPFAVLDSDAFRLNPVPKVMRDAAPIRRRIAEPDGPDDFLILEELRAEGVTDYLALPLVFTDGAAHAITFTTKRPGGFTHEHIAALGAVQAPLARLTEIFALRRTAANLLSTYVGHGSGERILEGNIRRGDIESIDAVIFLSDLRGFSTLGNERPGSEVIELLNDYFDCILPAIDDRGGEVLKFISDAVLAIFPLAGAPRGTCDEALAATRTGLASLAALDKPGRPALRCGIALHVGQVLYGNIGGANRLDFTAIGPAVNLAARLERISAETGRAIILSADLAWQCGASVESLGHFELRGFAEEQEVFAPA
jgi:adenylate cyclase